MVSVKGSPSPRPSPLPSSTAGADKTVLKRPASQEAESPQDAGVDPNLPRKRARTGPAPTSMGPKGSRLPGAAVSPRPSGSAVTAPHQEAADRASPSVEGEPTRPGPEAGPATPERALTLVRPVGEVGPRARPFATDLPPDVQRLLDQATQCVDAACNLPTMMQAMAATAALPHPDLRHPLLRQLVDRAQELAAPHSYLNIQPELMTYLLFDTIDTQAAPVQRHALLAQFLDDRAHHPKVSLALRMRSPDMLLEVLRSGVEALREAPPDRLQSRLRRLVSRAHDLAQLTMPPSYLRRMALVVHRAIGEFGSEAETPRLHAYMLSPGTP